MFSSASDKPKLFANNFSKNSNLDYSCIFLPVFPSRTNLKLHNISISGSKELWAWTFIHTSWIFQYMSERVSFSRFLVVPVFNNVAKRSTANNYCPVSLFSVVSKIFEKLVNNRIVDHLEKCGFFSISSMVLGLLNSCRSSHSCIW